MAADLSADLKALQETLVPGGSLQVTDVRTTSTTLSQTFERPLVFAYDGMSRITDDGDACKKKM